MKYRPRSSKTAKLTAALLALILFTGSFSGSALAEGQPSDSSGEFVSFSDGEELPGEPEHLLPEESLLLTEGPALTAGPEEETEEPASEKDSSPRQVTWTFNLGVYGTKTVTLEQGQYPGWDDVPEIPELPAAQILGWYSKAGSPVDPAAQPAEQDAVYTARWGRNVDELLNTDDHIAYIKGSNHLFRPSLGLTRAEAAQMFYSLLRDQNQPRKTFPDVKAGQWYAPAVETMAGLGIVRGKNDDGNFYPSHAITRAEFVTMAVGFDTLPEGTVQVFPDVPASSWVAPYVAAAAAKGWISGSSDGYFHPNDIISRAEAVTIINKMLGRSPDTHIKTMTDLPDFYDLYPSNWAYGQILEAATEHTYTRGDAGETWVTHQAETAAVTASQWFRDNGKLYYLDAATGKFLRGDQDINGVHYVFDKTTGAAYTGFHVYGGWRRYYREGVQVNDISDLGVVSGPYYIKVYKNANYLVIFARDEKGEYNTPVKAMRVSCGKTTPAGTYYTPSKYRWLQMVGDTWAQWCTQIQGNYLFHSVPNWTKSNLDLEVGEYNLLGETRSLGCVRLNCGDAKWIYDNCSLGTKVYISSWETAGPLPKPNGIQIPSWHTWDPTDPTAVYRCKQVGCH